MKKNTPDIAKLYALAVKGSHLLLIVLLILIITIFLITRSKIDTQTTRLSEDLQALYRDEIKIRVELDETIPIKLAVPLGDLIDLSQLLPESIPLDTTVPVRTSVRINQTVTVPIDLPLFGRTMVDMPLDLNVPINQDIPLKTIIEIDPSAFQDPEKIIYIEQDLPVNLPLELNISMEELGLESNFEGVESLIDTLRFVFLLGGLDWSND